MKLDLDSLKSEILEYLSKEGLIVFHAYSRRLDDVPAVAWDSERYADFRLFLETAKKAGAELIVFHHREFTGTYVDHALAVLEDTELEPDDRRRIERRLNFRTSLQSLRFSPAERCRGTTGRVCSPPCPQPVG